MSILKRILGEPGFAVEADSGDGAAADAAVNEVATVTDSTPAPPAPTPVEAATDDSSEAETEDAPADPSPEPVEAEETSGKKGSSRKQKSKKRKSKNQKSSAGNQASGSQSVMLPAVDPIQSLVDSAIAQASSQTKAEQEATGAKTFATDYLVVPSVKGRRRPGPSVAKFMNIATTMGRR